MLLALAAAAQPDGGFVVVFRDYRDDSAWARLFGPDGAPRTGILALSRRVYANPCG